MNHRDFLQQMIGLALATLLLVGGCVPAATPTPNRVATGVAEALTVIPTATPTAIATNTPAPTATPTVTSTGTPTPSPTNTPTSTPTSIKTPTARPTATPTTTPTPLPDAMVNVKTLNVRSGPGTVYDILAGVHQGDELEVIGQAYDCGWLKVIVPQGAQGWVAGGPEHVIRNLPCELIPAAPIPPSTGSVQGKLVEAPLRDDAVERPNLTNVLVVLCLKTAKNHCTVDADLSTRSNAQGEFTFDSLVPGEYIVLYSPFLLTNESTYWIHWDGRRLDFSDAESLFNSLAPGDKTIFINGGPDGGVGVTLGAAGKWQLTTVSANTAIWSNIHPLIVEFVGEQEPLTVNVKAGQTSQLTIQSHAKILE